MTMQINHVHVYDYEHGQLTILNGVSLFNFTVHFLMEFANMSAVVRHNSPELSRIGHLKLCTETILQTVAMALIVTSTPMLRSKLISRTSR